MITVEEAKKILADTLAEASPLPIRHCPLTEAAGSYLAEHLEAPHSRPYFDESAMDGYAFRWEDRDQVLEQAGEIAAGASLEQPVEPGTCIRIFTGGKVPPGADTVVPQELTQQEATGISIQVEKLSAGANIRRRGEEIAAGDRAMEKGAQLMATDIGFLAGMGMRSVPISSKPGVTITVTGSEFAHSEAELAQGKKFESNGQMLTVALSMETGISSQYQVIEDDRDQLIQRIATALPDNHVHILTGGVSVGKYDFTREALEANGYTILFHKVAQKPGKPMLFARKGERYAFGLPGNPRAVAVGWIEYVRPFLKALQGASHYWPEKKVLPLAEAFRKREGRAQFLAAREQNGKLVLNLDKGSHILRNLGEASWLAFFPTGGQDFPAGHPVEAHLI